jgi:hypothetical protein
MDDFAFHFPVKFSGGPKDGVETIANSRISTMEGVTVTFREGDREAVYTCSEGTTFEFKGYRPCAPLSLATAPA